ncbi:membrane hypothetical protein [uncultured Gammaproteobacteria bacterium]
MAMKLPAALVAAVTVFLIVGGAVRLAHPAAAADAVAVPAERPHPSPSPWVHREDRLFDRNTVTLGCLTGASIGPFFMGLNPVFEVTAYAGWMVGVGSMIARSGLGCWFGSMAGMTISATALAVNKTTAAMSGLFSGGH